MSFFQEPFDLLGSSSKIVPLMPRTRLNEMADKALHEPQLSALPRTRMLPEIIGIGAMIAACLLLFIAPIFQHSSSGNGDLAYGKAHKKTYYAENSVDESNSDTNDEIVDLVMLDTLEGF